MSSNSKIHYESMHPALERIETADSYFKRLKGLMSRKNLPKGCGLLLTKCGQIHTCFMRFPIDVVYLSDDFRVLDIQSALPPWRVGRFVRGARHVLEMPPNEAAFVSGEQIIQNYR